MKYALILIFCPAASAIIGIVTLRSMSRSRARRLSPLALRWNGVAIPGQFVFAPKLVFRVDEIPAEVTF